MLADITPYTDLVQELDSLFENIDDEDEKEIVYPEYTRKDFLSKTDYFLKMAYCTKIYFGLMKWQIKLR